jgi:hypothetical protein
MSQIEKPIVFLSHSSLDKAPLAELKKILHERTVGSVNFFLSSDGQSIKFGRNWIVSVSDALAKAKLMFVFLSPQSADSKWIHFEAGYACASIPVVPVCLPGIDFNRVTPPLSHLQGFNLHTYEALGNIARICNEELKLEMPEIFKPDDFHNIVRQMTGHGASFFGDYSWAIEEIKVSSVNDIPSENYSPIPALDEICKKAKIKCRSKTQMKNVPLGHDNGLLVSDFEQPGCVITFSHTEDGEEQRARLQRIREHKASGSPAEKPVPRKYSFNCTLSPDLFHVNAPLLDQWFETAKLGTLKVQIRFRKSIDSEKQRQQLTAKLYQCGVDLLENGSFQFEGFEFDFGQYGNTWIIHFELLGKLEDKRLSEIIQQMFKSTVLWEHEPNLSEMFQ